MIHERQGTLWKMQWLVSCDSANTLKYTQLSLNEVQPHTSSSPKMQELEIMFGSLAIIFPI